MSIQNAMKQVAGKPEKLARFKKFSFPKKRKFGKMTHQCRKCSKTSGVIVKYGLLYCRQCFREEARRLGFRKYN